MTALPQSRAAALTLTRNSVGDPPRQNDRLILRMARNRRTYVSPVRTLSSLRSFAVLNTGVDETPCCRELSSIECLLDRVELLHVIVPIWHSVVPRLDDSLLESRFLMIVGMIAPQAIDVACESGEPAAEKDSTSGGH